MITSCAMREVNWIFARWSREWNVYVYDINIIVIVIVFPSLGLVDTDIHILYIHIQRLNSGSLHFVTIVYELMSTAQKYCTGIEDATASWLICEWSNSNLGCPSAQYQRIYRDEYEFEPLRYQWLNLISEPAQHKASILQQVPKPLREFLLWAEGSCRMSNFTQSCTITIWICHCWIQHFRIRFVSLGWW